ncbi:uncharacterized protein LOC142582495 isoform X1 [Dermacentor variabilis]|uniref:uncharacterized protein LOC142582495 isoform X1 n=1 Tax=Dermacentor variabilis TaxID=34621 RepID=UPI003F5AE323
MPSQKSLNDPVPRHLGSGHVRDFCTTIRRTPRGPCALVASCCFCAAEHNHRHKRQLNGLFTSILDGVKNLVNTGTSIAGLGTGMLNLGGDEGIGGVVSGMLNLLSIGSEIFTGILGTLLNGDLLGGLLPFVGGQG